MIKYILPLLLLVGCDNSHSIDFSAVKNYTPTVDVAGPLSYSGNNIRIDSFVGQFKLEIKNPTGEKLTNVQLLVTVNDPALVGNVFFSRIYHEIFWGGGIFTQPTAGALLAPEITPPINGFLAVVDGDDLPSYTSVQFDSIVLAATPGLVMNFQVYGSINNQVVYATEPCGITVSFNF